MSQLSTNRFIPRRPPGGLLELVDRSYVSDSPQPVSVALAAADLSRDAPQAVAPPPLTSISSKSTPPAPPRSPHPPLLSATPGPPPPPPPPSRSGADALPPPPSPRRNGGTGLPPPPPLGHGGVPGPPPPPGHSGPPPPPPPGTKGSNGVQQPTSLKPLHWNKVTRALQGSIWADIQKQEDKFKAPEIDINELESLFSAASVSDNAAIGGAPRGSKINKPEKVQLVDFRRAYNCEIMLTKIKIPLPDILKAVLALDATALDIDQVENLIKLCPTKEEMETLKVISMLQTIPETRKCSESVNSYFTLHTSTGLKVPRVESKLRVFAFTCTFASQVSDLRKKISVINDATIEVKESEKLRQIMQTILTLGNALNQLELLSEKMLELLDFDKDLVHIDAASKIPFKDLAEEVQEVSEGLKKANKILYIFAGFQKVSDLRKPLSVINDASIEVKESEKLRQIMQTIITLENALNHGTARGSAIGFKLDNLLKLTDTRARNNKMTLMHYLCKLISEKMLELLEFDKDLVHIDAASKIPFKDLAEEVQEALKGFCNTAEAEVQTLISLYTEVGRNGDSLSQYFGEDPVRCPFEQVTQIFSVFAKMFKKARDEMNRWQLE
ncbi:formin-like protein 14 [Tanacetum coccineum]